MINITGTGKISYLGQNDRQKHLFENMWPLPYGVSYNAYLINDEKTALIDTVDSSAIMPFCAQLKEALQGRPLDYLIVNHLEPDHSAAIGRLLELYPNMQVVGNLQTFKILKHYFGVQKNILEVTDGYKLSLGYHQLSFYLTPFVHWPETMMTYDNTEDVLFAGDAFGSFRALDGGIFDDEIDFERDYQNEMLRYYSNIVGKYSAMVQKAFAKVGHLNLKYICSTHGPIWRNNPSKVVGLYDRWSKYEADDAVLIAFASMYGNTEKVADALARQFVENGVKDVHVYDVSKTHVSYLLQEVWRSKAVLLGSCAYNGEMHPMMTQFCHELKHAMPKNKILGLFGSFSWSGGGVRTLQTFAEKMNWEQPAEPLEIQGLVNDEKVKVCAALAKAIAQKIKS
ncbi:MAG: FprA family A-type flavoprotein [Bacteroidales bacterium]